MHEPGSISVADLSAQIGQAASFRFFVLTAAAGLCLFFLYQRFRKGRWMGVLVSLLAMAAAVYVGLALMLWLFQPRLVFYPMREHDWRPEEVGLPYESVKIYTEDGIELDAWFVPAQNASYTILFSHGNAGNISHRLDSLLLFREWGLNCLIFDYRGYGRSGGRPSEEGVYRDAAACWKWLTEVRQIPPETIVLYGQSLGGAVAANLAARLAEQAGPQPAGLVIESTFSSIVDMGRHYYPWFPIRWFARFRFNTVQAVRKVHIPILVIHSPEDEIVPFEFGQKIFDSANPPKQFSRISGSHNEGFLQDLQTYQTIWKEWIEHLRSSEESAPEADKR
ncbi:MAG TPA: alpha/beta hydrolase [Anaerohalosphaeraceae bacterium]|nr:alpha/beta hydrolase [Anaerohalosphaeraceae bacterium]